MGSFFTNIQVSTKNEDSHEIKNKIINYISKLLNIEGFEITNDLEQIDREIVIISHSDEKWIGIYDEATEDQNLEYLNNISLNISEKFKTKIINITVHDSDVLNMNFYSNGKKQDTYCNNINYFSGKKKKTKGNPEVWKEFLNDKNKLSELKNIWNKDEIFAEDILFKILNLFDIEYKYCILGYNYLQYENFKNKTVLKFKLQEKYKINNKEKGLPVFDFAGLSNIVNKISVDDDFDLSSLSVRNIGGESKGVIVYVYGPAVEEDLILPKSVNLRKINGISKKTGKMEFEDFESDLKKEIDNNGMLIYIAKYKNFMIKAAFNQNSLLNLKPVQLIKKSAQQLNQNIRINIKLKALKPGNKDLYVGISPIANPKDGFFGNSFSFEIIKSDWKPVNYINDLIGQRNHVLLNQKNVLFTHIIFDSINEKNKSLLKNTIIQFHEILSSKLDKEYIINFTKEGEIYPKQKKIKMEKLLKSSFWKNLDNIIGKKTNINFLIEDEKKLDIQKSIYKTSGIKLLNHISFIPGENNVSSSILFWNYLDKNINYEKLLDKILNINNDLIKNIDIIQAYTGCWGDNPMPGYGTIYENCCGIEGSYAHIKEWDNKYLRGITENIWLGKVLYDQINLTEINKITNITDIGKSKYIKLNNPADIPILEKLLSKIMPDKEKYLSFQKNYFNRNQH